MAILALAVGALVTGAAEARSARKADECLYLPPFYLGACTSDEACRAMCAPYYPENPDVGACLPAWICCICE